jgi:NADH:ubiquinone oxidoreductase subunit E
MTTGKVVSTSGTDPLAVPEQRGTIDRVIAESKDVRGAPMIVMNALQSEIGYITVPMQRYIAKRLRVPMSQIHGVLSFYAFFTTRPRGRHCMKLCKGTACYVRGASKLIEKAKETLGVGVGETTDDWRVTLEVCRCVGACSQAPTVTIDDDIYARVTPDQLPEIISRYQ